MTRIVLSGIFYPMAILRYFENALRRRGDVELFTVGPYSGRQIPWGGGMLLPGKYAKSPDVRIPFGGTQVPFGWVERRLEFEPDLWIQIDAGFQLEGKPRHGINAVVATDPHVLDYAAQRASADVFFCMQKTYSESGDIYLPYAYDPVWHAPVDSAEKEWDAILLGLHYEHRDCWVEELRQQGVIVQYDLGPIFQEARELYGRSRVGLNWSTLRDLNARVFEVLGMGLPLVTNHVPDMSEFFEEDRDYLGFSEKLKGTNAVMELLKNPPFARAIAHMGHQRVKPHTYDARVTQILEEVGLG